MVSTSCADELHNFARALGLKREWYQTPGCGERLSHYDLTTIRMRKKAVRFGAEPVDPKQIIKRAWWARWSAVEWQQNPDRS
jgi:hypothetical protein